MINKRYNTTEICTMCLGEHYGITQSVNYILYDSRAQQKYVESMFVALIGRRQDGHQYIEEAYKKAFEVF